MNISNQRVEEIINFVEDLNLDKKYQKEFTTNKIKLFNQKNSNALLWIAINYAGIVIIQVCREILIISST